MISHTDDLHKDYCFDQDQLAWGQEIEFPSSRKVNQYTHLIYGRYPARSISLVPRSILKSVRQKNVPRRKLSVLDPFMGSGTTAVEGALQAFNIFGAEVDPFARLVTQVKVRAYSWKSLRRLAQTFDAIRTEWRHESDLDAYVPRLRNVRYWFDDLSFENLLKLKAAISKKSTNEEDRDFFMVVLANMIRPCSKAERQTLKPYISRKYVKEPADVASTFVKTFDSYYSALELFSASKAPHHSKLQWLGMDGLQFTSPVKDIDIAITSPPYINALDYVRCIRIESAWIDTGTDEVFDKVRDFQVGDQRRNRSVISQVVEERTYPYAAQISELDKVRARVVDSYFEDMYSNIQSVFHCLVSGAEYHIIVGDSTIRGVYVPTHLILADLGVAVGFHWTRHYMYRIKDHRTSIPRNGQGGKIQTEHVISLRKP